jgi:DNA polymerase beta
LSSIQEVLSEENSVAWRLLGNVVKTGKIPEVEKLGPETRAAILFHTVHGIGPKKATDLAAEGFRTLDELRARPDKLTKAQRLGLDYYDDLTVMIPRSEIDTFRELFSEALKIVPEIKFEICGSYRRGNALCSDIDIIAWHPSYNDRKGTMNTEHLMELVWIALRNAGLTFEDKCLGRGKTRTWMRGIQTVSLTIPPLVTRLQPQAPRRLWRSPSCPTKKELNGVRWISGYPP